MGRAHVQRAPEDIGKTEDVIDLIGIVGAAGGDDRIGPHRLGLFRHDLGHWVGQCQNQRFVGHGFHHIAGQNSGLGQSQKDIRANDSFGQRTGRSIGSVGGFLWVEIAASLVNHAPAVADDDIFPPQAQAE